MVWYAFLVFFNAIPLQLHVLENTRGSLFLTPGALLGLLECARHAAVPVIYMAFPPTMPLRNDLMEVDEQGAQRPRRETQKAKRKSSADNGMTWWDAAEVMIIYMCDWS